MKVSIWLIDGSVYQDVTVAGSNLTVDGNPLDINSVSGIDSAYIYTIGGAKIERDHAGGTIQIVIVGVAGNVRLDLVQIADLKRSGG